MDEPLLKEELLQVLNINNSSLENLYSSKSLLDSVFKRTTCKSCVETVKILAELHFNLKLLHDKLSLISKSGNKKYITQYLTKTDIWWARGFFNKAVSNSRKTKNIIFDLFNLIENYYEIKSYTNEKKIRGFFISIKLFLEQNSSCIIFLLKQNHIRQLIAMFEKNPISTLENSNLKIGDVILSYKSNKFLSKHFMSLLIYLFGGSRFTHSSLVCDVDNGKVKTISANGEKRVVGVSDIYIEDGEVFFVFRPEIDNSQKERLLEQIEVHKKSLLLENYNFSMAKFWFAFIEGVFFRIIDILLRRIIMVQNPFANRKGYFCSEVVNEIFFDANIYLTPRSKYSSIVTPAELSWSQCLCFIGFICKEGSFVDSKRFFG